MTRGNQRELARQKNMKKQSDSVKGKRRDDGLSAAARKQSAMTSSGNFLYSACVYFPPCPLPTQRVHTDLLCSCALRLLREWRSISSTACSRWKVAVPAHMRYTAPEPLSTGQ
uniref:Uncharacterized protein n=1 Tax=Ovis aries TaxID=9940 RepID=A0AC11EPD5_SHEEP